MSDKPNPDRTPQDDAIDRLRAAGLRVTHPRITLLRLLENRHAPLSIEDIHRAIPDARTNDLVTIYRCLAAFESCGFVRRCYAISGTAMWEIVREGFAPYHIISKATADTFPLDRDLSAELRIALTRVEETLKSRGYKDVSHKVQFFVGNEGRRNGSA